MNGRPTWLLFIAQTIKTIVVGHEDEDDEPTNPKTGEPAKKVKRGIPRIKWKEEKEKLEGAEQGGDTNNWPGRAKFARTVGLEFLRSHTCKNL